MGGGGKAPAKNECPLKAEHQQPEGYPTLQSYNCMELSASNYLNKLER